jgi:lipid II:glycine glycyltransferase (peptidoglycan interpeptide bridge formation enzyme)
VAIDLGPSEETLLRSFHHTARRHIRAADKRPVAVRPITDPALGPRLDALRAETMARTGGRHVPQDWSSLIRFSAAHPESVRLVGMFAAGQDGPGSLLAFAMGMNHGDHVEYSTAASTRHTNGLHVPLGYALAWDLIRWGRSGGAAWFDFGGITDGCHQTVTDPLGGISDFKRYFSRNVVAVSDEWMLEPSPVLGGAARAVSAVSARKSPEAGVESDARDDEGRSGNAH